MFYLAYLGLYLIGIGMGFCLLPCVIRRKHNEKEALELDEFYDKLFVSSKFTEEVYHADPSNLSQEELAELKNKVLTYTVPYVLYKVIMYYDSELEGFCYYSNADIVYKYLDVVCRKYVLDFKCKQLYKFSEETKAVEKTPVLQRGPFVNKVERILLEKDTNRFIYKGKIKDYEKKQLELPKDISYRDFLILQQQTQDTQSKELG